MTKEALKLALEALESCDAAHITDGGRQWYDEKLVDKAITAIYEALAQPEHGWTPERIAGMARLKEAQDKKLAQPEQEPCCYGGIAHDCHAGEGCRIVKRMKAASPQRTWAEFIRGVRVDGDTVVITAKGGNKAARLLCGALIEEMNK